MSDEPSTPSAVGPQGGSDTAVEPVVVYKARADTNRGTVLFALRRKHRGSKKFIRDFKQFQELHDALGVQYPGEIIPSLPDPPFPQLLSDAEYIEKKRRRTNHFLRRLAARTTLSASSVFISFCSPGDFEVPANLVRPPTETSTAAAVVETGMAFFKSVMRTLGKPVASPLTSVEGVDVYVPALVSPSDDQFNQHEKVRLRVTELGRDLGAVVDALGRHDVARRGLASHQHRSGEDLIAASRSESQGPVCSVLELLGRTLMAAARLEREQGQVEIMLLGDMFVQYSRDIPNVKAVLNTWTRYVRQWDDATKTSKQLGQELQQSEGVTKGDPTALRRTKQQIQKAEQAAKDAQRRLEVQTACMTEGFGGYEHSRRRVMVRTMRQWVGRQIDTETRRLSMWENLLENLTGSPAAIPT